jgi:hypothetical protein
MIMAMMCEITTNIMLSRRSLCCFSDKHFVTQLQTWTNGSLLLISEKHLMYPYSQYTHEKD